MTGQGKQGSLLAGRASITCLSPDAPNKESRARMYPLRGSRLFTPEEVTCYE